MMDNRKAQEDEDRLTLLLREWKDIEPKAGFEATVWRRIRAASVQEPHLSLTALLRGWFMPRPVWVSLMAAAAGVLVGVGLAFSSFPARDGHNAYEPLLHSQTLAGSYFSMATGGTR